MGRHKDNSNHRCQKWKTGRPPKVRGSYPFLVQVRLDLRIVVQPDPLEQSIRGVGHLFRRLRMGKIKFKRGLEEPFRLGLLTDGMEASHEENL